MNNVNPATELNLDINRMCPLGCGSRTNQRLSQIYDMYSELWQHFENYVRIVCHQRGQQQMCHGATHAEASAGARLCVVQDQEVCHEDTSEAVGFVTSYDWTLACL